MRKAWAVCALALAVAAVGATLLVGPASATPPASVTFELLRNGPPDREPTTWSSSGAMTASGTWVIDRFVCGACPAPTTGVPQFDTTLTASGGTFEMRLRNVFRLDGSVDSRYREIVSGTGAYAKVRGHGSYDVWIDENGVRHIVCVGETHSA
jgi:hypothetical protein